MENLPPPGGGGSLRGDVAGSGALSPAAREQKVRCRRSPSAPKADALVTVRDEVQDITDELGDAEEDLEDAEEELHEQARAVELTSVLTSSSIMAAALYTKRDMLRLFFGGNDDHVGGGSVSGSGAGNSGGVMISAMDLLDLAAIALGAVVVPVSAALTARAAVTRTRRRSRRRKAAPMRGSRERALDEIFAQRPAAAGRQLTPLATESSSRRQSSVSSRHVGGGVDTCAQEGPMQPKLSPDDMDSSRGSTRTKANDNGRNRSRSRSLNSNRFKRKSSGGSDSGDSGHASGNTPRRRGRGKKRATYRRHTSRSRRNGSDGGDGDCSSSGRSAASLIALVDLALAASAGQPAVGDGEDISELSAEAGGTNAKLEEKVSLSPSLS